MFTNNEIIIAITIILLIQKPINKLDIIMMYPQES